MTTIFPLRRHVIKMLGGAAALAGLQKVALAQSALVGSPSLTEGPYFVEDPGVTCPEG